MSMVDLAQFSRAELEAALATHSSTRSDDGCLLWDGPKRPSGYGLTRVGGRVASVHRVSCFLAHGAPPPGANDTCHACDTPACFEPSHLHWGSRSQNMKEAFERGRLRYQSDPSVIVQGERHGHSRLTEADIAFIISSPLSTAEVGRRLNYAKSNVRAIRNGRLWIKTVARIRTLSNPGGGLS